MRLDDVIAAQKRSALLWAAFIGGLLLMFVPPFEAWRGTVATAPGAVTNWLITGRGFRRWAALLGACGVAGMLFVDYLFQQAHPVVSPYLFGGIWFAVMTPFAFWLARKEQRETPTGERRRTIPS